MSQQRKSIIPDDFLWGGAVTSFQTEGAWNEGGKGLSIVDARPIPKGHSDWKVAVEFLPSLQRRHRFVQGARLYRLPDEHRLDAQFFRTGKGSRMKRAWRFMTPCLMN